MRKITIISLLLVSLGIAACGEKKAEWEVHFEKAQEYAGQNACGLALEEYDKAIEMNPEDPELYIRRGYCHLRNKGTEEKVIRMNLQENHDKALLDFAKAEELAQGNQELLDEIDEARAFMQQWEEAVNGIAPDKYMVTSEKAEGQQTSCTPLDPITYSYAVENTVVSTTCRAYNDQDVLIYQDFYNGGKENCGNNICRTYFFYDEEGKMIREEYKWDSNAQWYELMGGKPNVKEYIYDGDGDLLTINFLTPPDYRVFRIDHYNKRGELIYTENIDQNGTVTIKKSADYVPREEMEDWQALYDDALTLFNNEKFDEALKLIDQAIAIHPEEPDMYLTRFWCVITDMWNDDTFTAEDLDQQYDVLKEMIDKAEMYGADPGDIEFVRGRLETFREIVLERTE